MEKNLFHYSSGQLYSAWKHFRYSLCKIQDFSEAFEHENRVTFIQHLFLKSNSDIAGRNVTDSCCCVVMQRVIPSLQNVVRNCMVNDSKVHVTLHRDKFL